MFLLTSWGRIIWTHFKNLQTSLFPDTCTGLETGSGCGAWEGLWTRHQKTRAPPESLGLHQDLSAPGGALLSLQIGEGSGPLNSLFLRGSPSVLVLGRCSVV